MWRDIYDVLLAQALVKAHFQEATGSVRVKCRGTRNPRYPTKYSVYVNQTHDLLFREHLKEYVVLVHRLEDNAQLLLLEIHPDIR